MKKLLLTSILCFSTCFAAEQKYDADKEQIASRLKEFTQDVSQGNTDKLDAFWTSDAQLVNPRTGQVINGSKEISQYFVKKSQDLKGKDVQFKLTSIEMKNPNLATVQGEVEFFQNGTLVDRQARDADLVKENGVWYLDFVKEMTVDLPPAISYEHLKDLSWLLGNWRDRDQDVTIEYKAQWDRYKNFIVQRFDMLIYGLETLEGRQVITWDPITKQIRSWIFDSDGGFGQGTWSKTADGWSEKIDYTTPNGDTATSTNLYTKIEPTSYTYSSIDRKVGSTQLPNIEPVVVKKEE